MGAGPKHSARHAAYYREAADVLGLLDARRWRSPPGVEGSSPNPAAWPAHDLVPYNWRLANLSVRDVLYQDLQSSADARGKVRVSRRLRLRHG
jgi:hypothetical protein